MKENDAEAQRGFDFDGPWDCYIVEDGDERLHS